jgi:hypothetical protein
MLCECAPGGPDVEIGEHFVEAFIPEAEFIGVPMTNKANLMRDCGREVRRLIEREQCDIVFIVWDLAPPWPNQEENRCRHRDKEGIEQSLQAAYRNHTIPREKLILLCIEQMLESWVIADGEAVMERVRRRTHPPPRFNEPRRPDTDHDPKSRLISYFRQAGRQYNEHVDAVPILQRASLSKLRRSQSFKRLEEKLRHLASGE